MAKKCPFNFIFIQGEDFDLGVKYQDDAGDAIDLTGYTARMQARADYDSESAVIDITTDDSIEITAETGEVTVSLGNALTSNIEPGTYVYDLELVSGTGLVTKLLFGQITVLAEVTK